MLKTTILVLALTLPFVYSCKKEGCTDSSALNYSEEAEKDDGSCITTQEVQNTDTDTDAQHLFVEQFNVTFDNSNSADSYSPSFNYEEGDVIIMETSNQFSEWTALPLPIATDVYVEGSYIESSGTVWVYSNYEDGTAYTPTNSITMPIRVALIKKNELEANPNLENMTIAELKSELE